MPDISIRLSKSLDITLYMENIQSKILLSSNNEIYECIIKNYSVLQRSNERSIESTKSILILNSKLKSWKL